MSTSIILKKTPKGDIARSRDIGRVVLELEALPEEKAWRVKIEQFRSERSEDQNEYYWGCVLEMISDTTGYEKEELHEYFCGLNWGWKQKRVPKTPNNPQGIEDVPVRTTTTDNDGNRSVLGKLQFSEFVEFVRRFAASKLGLDIPDPDKNWKDKLPRKAA